MHNVAVIVGSLRQGSINKNLAKALERIGKDLFTFNIIPLQDVPMYNQDIEGAPGDAVVNLRNAVTAADAVLFITPEYNRSLPGVLKNAIDWASRPYGKFSLMNKPAATAGVSPGVIGTACAQQELRRILTMLTMPVMGQPEMFLSGMDLVDKDGNVSNPKTEEFLRSFLERFEAWITRTKM